VKQSAALLFSIFVGYWANEVERLKLISLLSLTGKLLSLLDGWIPPHEWLSRAMVRSEYVI
jgi:hypothetical protein